nr:hypothetical protein [Tanacetum cinerariifolium]
MVVPLPFTLNLYHDELFTVNPLEYAHFESRFIDDVSFDEHNGYDIIEMIHDDLHPRKPVGHVDSNSDSETNVPLDDVAHVVEQFEHENKGNYMQNDRNKLLALCGRDVSEGKCVGLKGKKPKIVNDDECETSKQGSKKGDGRKTVNKTLSKTVKEIWNKKGN